jgi:RNA polymerase sigma factor (TIGR02999 family)
MSEVTRILKAIDQGDPLAPSQLLPLVYEELHRLAVQKLASQKPGQTLQATALVNEAYLRLVKPDQDQQWNGRGHFFGAAAQAMRRILVESERRKRQIKRGGGWRREDLDELNLAQVSDDILALHEALLLLENADPEAAQVVQLRYFAGLTGDQTAAAMEISPRTVDRLWKYARAWLRHKLDADGPPPTHAGNDSPKL